MNSRDAAALTSDPAVISRRPDALRLVLIGLTYAFTSKLALLIPDAERVLAAVWPPGGVALAALLLSPRRQRRAILATIFVVGNVVNLVSGRPALASLGFMAANVLESWGCVWLFGWFCGEQPVTFARLREVQTLGLGAIGVNSVTALIGAAAAVHVLDVPFWHFYLTWWVADGLGLLLVAPLVVVGVGKWSELGAWRGLRLIEATTVGLIWSAIAWFGFYGSVAEYPIVPRPYWIYAPLVWVAVRFGPRLTAILLGVLTVIAVEITLRGQGELPLGGGDPEEHLRMVQLFLGVAIFTGLMLAAAVAERGRAELKLKASERLLNEAQAVAHVGSWQLVFNGRDRDWSGSAELHRIYGIVDQELTMQSGFNCTHPEDRERIGRIWDEFVCGEGPGEWEHRIVVDGLTKWVSVRAQPHHAPDGRLVRVTGTLQDITERRAAQQATRESAARFAAMADSLPVLIWESGPDKLCTYCNKTWLDFTGRTLEQEKGNGWIEGVHPDDLADCRNVFVGRFDARQEFKKEYRLRRHDGQYRWILDHGVPRYLSDGSFAGYVGSCVDITERKRILERLRISEESYRNQFAVNAAVMLLIDPQSGVIVDANQAAVGFYGYPRERLLSMRICDINSRPSADVREAIAFVGQNSGARFEFEHRLADGSTRAVDVSSSPIQMGECMLLHSIVFDITERKRAEAEVVAAREHYQLLLETATDGIHILDQEGNLVEASPSFYRMLGYGLDERPRLKVGDWDIQWSGEELKVRIANLLRQPAVFETRHRRCDGQIIEVEASGRGIEINGRMHLYVSSRDITDRKRAEKESAENQRHLASAMDQAHLAYWEMDAATNTFLFNDRFYALYGTTVEREGGYRMKTEDYAREFLPPEERHHVGDSVALLMGCKIDEIRIEHRIRRRDGELRDILVRVNLVRDAEDQVLGTRGSNQDITESKRAEDALRRASIYARKLIEVNLDPLFTISAAGKITDVNEASVEVTGVPREQLIGTDFSDYFTEPDKAREVYQKVFAEGLVRDYPLVIRHVAGRVTDVLYNASIYRDLQGQVLGVLASARDVTERIVQQRKVEALLEQTAQDAQTKSALLREVNHRVTNNLTSVLGLMVYEGNGLTGAARARTEPALGRLQQRIRGLLTVHRLLSQSTWAPINLAHLADEIIRAALNAAPWRNQAEVNIEPNALLVSPRQANGMALIFNELATNTVKHGHLDSRRTQIQVAFVVTEEVATICYRDNGPGFSSEVLEDRRSNIGLKLLRDIVATTLAGTVDLENDDGAKIAIRMQPEKETRT